MDRFPPVRQQRKSIAEADSIVLWCKSCNAGRKIEFDGYPRKNR